MTPMCGDSQVDWAAKHFEQIHGMWCEHVGSFLEEVIVRSAPREDSGASLGKGPQGTCKLYPQTDSSQHIPHTRFSRVPARQPDGGWSAHFDPGSTLQISGSSSC